MSLEKCGEVITLSEAKVLVEKFQTEHPTASKCYMVDADMLKAILNQEECRGIRFYKGLDKGLETMVLVGVNADRKDLTDGVIVDKVKQCPDECDVASQLYF